MSAATAFARASARLFSQFGEQAAINGIDTIAVISEDVQMIGDAGEIAARVTTAALPAESGAKVGDTLTLGSGDWLLDQRLRVDQHLAEFILRRATP